MPKVGISFKIKPHRYCLYFLVRTFDQQAHILQMVLGIGLGFTQCTAVLDVVKLMDNISGDETTTVATTAEERWAILMFTIMLCMTIIQYLYRDKIYQWCQSMLLRFRMSSQNTIAKAD